MAGCFEHGNKLSVSVKIWGVTTQAEPLLSSQKDSIPWSWLVMPFLRKVV
jgi:hypothetical protein